MLALLLCLTLTTAQQASINETIGNGFKATGKAIADTTQYLITDHGWTIASAAIAYGTYRFSAAIINAEKNAETYHKKTLELIRTTEGDSTHAILSCYDNAGNFTPDNQLIVQLKNAIFNLKYVSYSYPFSGYVDCIDEDIWYLKRRRSLSNDSALKARITNLIAELTHLKRHLLLIPEYAQERTSREINASIMLASTLNNIACHTAAEYGAYLATRE